VNRLRGMAYLLLAVLPPGDSSCNWPSFRGEGHLLSSAGTDSARPAGDLSGLRAAGVALCDPIGYRTCRGALLGGTI